MEIAVNAPTTGSLIHHQHVAATGSRPKIAIGPKSKHPQPEIRLIKKDDVIEAIEIHCACGEKMLIQCEYA